MAYDVNDRVYARCTFRDVNNAVVDPTTVTAKTKTPAGTSTTYTYGSSSELTKISTGIYQLQIDVATAGTWRVRFESTGTNKAAAEMTFKVNPTAF